MAAAAARPYPGRRRGARPVYGVGPGQRGTDVTGVWVLLPLVSHERTQTNRALGVASERVTEQGLDCNLGWHGPQCSPTRTST